MFDINNFNTKSTLFVLFVSDIFDALRKPFSVESKLAHDPAVKILVLTDTGHFPHTNIGANVVLKCSNYVKLGEFEVITPQQAHNIYRHGSVVQLSPPSPQLSSAAVLFVSKYELYTVIYHVLNLNKYWFPQMCRIL